jgi:hypothetical protein
LLRTPFFDLGQELSPSRVELQQLVYLLPCPPAGKRRFDAFRIAPDQLQV